MTIVEVRSVTKQFGGLVALAAVVVQVQPGDIHGIIGPNGSGKTTLFNVISSIYKPTAGEVWLSGVRIDTRPPYAVARLGLARTFQTPRLFASMTVEEHLLAASHAAASPWRFDVQARGRAREALAFVGLLEHAERLATTLPQGQRRLLEIARALQLRPKVLLLDEPHAGLNPVETQHLVEVISGLRRSGMTILLVEHEMPMVMSLADRITVLNFGRVIAEGKPEAIQRDAAVIEAYLGQRAEGVAHVE